MSYTRNIHSSTLHPLHHEIFASKQMSYTAIGRHIYKRLKMCKQYAKEMATLQ